MEDRIASTLLKRIEEAVQHFFLSKLIFCLLKIMHFKVYYYTIKILQYLQNACMQRNQPIPSSWIEEMCFMQK